SSLAASMSAAASAHADAWFDCSSAPAPDVEACLIARDPVLGGVDAYVVPVLEERHDVCSAPCWRDDGHRRFYRLFFRPRSHSELFLSVHPKLKCEVIASIRDFASSALSTAELAGLRVGTEWCAAHALGFEGLAGASTELSTYHLVEVGADDPRFLASHGSVA